MLIWLLFRQRSFYDSVSVTLSHELFKVVSPSTLPTVWSNRSYYRCFILDTSALMTVLGHVAVKSPQCVGRLPVCRFQHSLSGYVPKVDVVWFKISVFIVFFVIIILAAYTTDFCHCLALRNWFGQLWKLQVARQVSSPCQVWWATDQGFISVLSFSSVCCTHACILC